MMTNSQPIQSIRPQVRCKQCRSVIFDGQVIKSRIVKILDIGAEAKCQCKNWVTVPITYGLNK